MRRIPFFLVSLVVLAMVCPASVLAKLCRDLQSRDQAACKAAVGQQCGSVSGYWPKRRCEEGVAGGYDSCAKPAALTACRMVNRERRAVCDVVASRMNDKNLGAWLKAVGQFPALLERLKRVRSMLKGCGWNIGCSSPRQCRCKCGNSFGV
ncbi:MAG: hypothetical protein ABI333_03065 [bacterium]